MNALRSVREARINFLFFQDIITCVMGILILATLILSLSLDTGEAATPEETQMQSQLKQMRQTLAQLQEQNRATEQQQLTLASLPERPVLESELAVARQQATNSANQVRELLEKSAAAIRRSEQAATDQQRTAQMLNEIGSLKKQISATRDDLADARQRTNSIYIVPAPDAQQPAREPVAFVVGLNKLEVKRANSSLSETHGLSSGEDLRSILMSLDPAHEYVVFYFRPSGTKWFEPFRNLARSFGFVVGYDAVEEQKEVIFSTK